MGEETVNPLTHNQSLFPEDSIEELSPEEKQEVVLRGAHEPFTFGGTRPTQSFTLRMPYTSYITLKHEVGRLYNEADKLAPQTKGMYTMSNYINSAVKNIIIPGLKRLSVEPEEKSPAK